MITFVRNIFGGVLTVIDLAVKSEAMGRAFAANAAASWLDQVEESSEVLEPRSFVCNTRAEEPITADSLLRYNDIECDVCATEHADFPGARIACGTPGCPNSSYPSAPGIPHRSDADCPESGLRADARDSGHQTSPVAAGSQQRANEVGGVASAVELSPGVGAGQPLDREAHEALYEVAWELVESAKGKSQAEYIRLCALAAEIRDLAHQFEADTKADTN